MSDNIQRFMSVRTALIKSYPGNPGKRRQRHLSTLAALVAGIVGSGSTHLSKVAQKAPDRTKTESRIKRMTRFIQNEGVSYRAFYLPYAREVVAALAGKGPLLLIFDGSALGRGCATMMASLVYGKRTLPLAWLVKRGAKGHFSAEDHIDLLSQVRALIPAGSEVIFLGDGEFDSIALQEALSRFGYSYVCRTACSTRLSDGFTDCAMRDLNPCLGACYLSMPHAFCTAEQYGPVHAIVWHEPGHRDPIFLLTNLDLAEEACFWYRHRFRIETFFSDQKSRGFHLHKSHIADPERLERLLIAACLAYIWMIYLGVEAIKEGWYKLFHRSERIDLSLFQLGRRLLEHMLNQGWALRVAFKVTPFPQTVR